MNLIKHISFNYLMQIYGRFGFTCSFEFDDFDVGDIGNADPEDENTSTNIENTTNNDLLGFENASELSDMETIDGDKISPPGELDV